MNKPANCDCQWPEVEYRTLSGHADTCPYHADRAKVWEKLGEESALVPQKTWEDYSSRIPDWQPSAALRRGITSALCEFAGGKTTLDQATDEILAALSPPVVAFGATDEEKRDIKDAIARGE